MAQGHSLRASAFTARIVTAEGDSSVGLQGVGEVGGQIEQNSHLNTLAEPLFEDYVSLIGSPKLTAGSFLLGSKQRLRWWAGPAYATAQRSGSVIEADQARVELMDR